MDFTFLESAAEISTHDLFILIKSRNRRSSSAVHWLPRCPAMSLPCFFAHDGITTSRPVPRRAIDSLLRQLPETNFLRQPDLARRFALLTIVMFVKTYRKSCPSTRTFVDEIKGFVEPGPPIICPISQLPNAATAPSDEREGAPSAQASISAPAPQPLAAASSPRRPRERPGQRSVGKARAAPDTA
jgi:hypothetical protein